MIRLDCDSGRRVREGREGKELYRFFTDLTGKRHGKINFLGFDQVRMGSGARGIFDFGFSIFD